MRKKYLGMIAGLGLVAVSSPAWAADQQQIEADQAAAAALQSGYNNTTQLLGDAYESLRQHQRQGGDTQADLQNIRDLRTTLNTTVAHMRNNSRDLQNDGASGYSLPNRIKDGWNRQRDYRDSYRGHEWPRRNWNQWPRHDHEQGTYHKHQWR